MAERVAELDRAAEVLGVDWSSDIFVRCNRGLTIEKVVRSQMGEVNRT